MTPGELVHPQALPASVGAVYEGRYFYRVSSNYRAVRGADGRTDFSVVEYLGQFVTMWANAHGGSHVVEMQAVPPGATFESVLPGLAVKLARRCKHDDHTQVRELTVEEARARGVPHFGACFHVMACLACGSTFACDSSD